MALAAGSIAFVQIGATDPDEFSFVAIVDIPTTETIYFTDNGWLSTGTFRSGEGTLKYTPPTKLTAGQVVSWNSTNTASAGFSTVAGSFSLSGAGDQIIAFQATYTNNVLTKINGLVAAIQSGNGSASWNINAENSNTSAVPGTGSSLTLLADGTYSVALAYSDDYFTNGNFSKEAAKLLTPSDALSVINKSKNWTGGDGNGKNASQDTQSYDFTALCYLAGTHIRTPSGERRIETLAIGDEITTIDGTQRLRWIGRHSYHRAVAGPWVSPIRISTDAFGQGLPHRDLLVSPWHAILLGDVLVRAADLVNGSTITQIFPGMVAHYLNLEFDAPTVVYAEGVAAETYANHANRHMFENAAEYTALYGDDARVMIDAAGNNLRRFPIVFDGPRFQDALRRANAHRRYA